MLFFCYSFDVKDSTYLFIHLNNIPYVNYKIKRIMINIKGLLVVNKKMFIRVDY
jgi:hypothetical protein